LNRNHVLSHRDSVMGLILLLVLVALGLGVMGFVFLAVVFIIRLVLGKSAIKTRRSPYSYGDNGYWTQPSVFGPASDAAAAPPTISAGTEDSPDRGRHHGLHGDHIPSNSVPESASDSCIPTEVSPASGCSSDSGSSDSGGSSSCSRTSSE